MHLRSCRPGNAAKPINNNGPSANGGGGRMAERPVQQRGNPSHGTYKFDLKKM